MLRLLSIAWMCIAPAWCSGRLCAQEKIDDLLARATSSSAHRERLASALALEGLVELRHSEQLQNMLQKIEDDRVWSACLAALARADLAGASRIAEAVLDRVGNVSAANIVRIRASVACFAAERPGDCRALVKELHFTDDRLRAECMLHAARQSGNDGYLKGVAWMNGGTSLREALLVLDTARSIGGEAGEGMLMTLFAKQGALAFENDWLGDEMVCALVSVIGSRAEAVVRDILPERAALVAAEMREELVGASGSRVYADWAECGPLRAILNRVSMRRSVPRTVTTTELTAELSRETGAFVQWEVSANLANIRPLDSGDYRNMKLVPTVLDVCLQVSRAYYDIPRARFYVVGRPRAGGWTVRIVDSMEYSDLRRGAEEGGRQK